MIWKESDNLIDNLPRLLQEDIEPDFKSVRIYRKDGTDYIQLEDYMYLENIPGVLHHIVMENDLDVNNLGFVVDETHIIDNPHMVNKIKNVINPNKIVVKKMNTDNYARAIKEAIEEFESTGSWNRFDVLLERKSWPIIAGAQGIHKALAPKIKETKKELAHTAGKYALGGLALAGAVHAGLKYVDKKADEDARIPLHSGKRSELIKKLRVMSGKYREYESKYDKASYAQKNIIQKILYKIKNAIMRLKGQLSRNS